VAGLVDEERPEVLRLCEKLWSKNGSPISVQAAFRLSRVRLSKAPFGIAWNQDLDPSGSLWSILFLGSGPQAPLEAGPGGVEDPLSY
jgi:hypothetical protein